MRKIPTLFVRNYEIPHRVQATSVVTPGLEWVLNGKGVATVKIDGACCAIIDGVFYRRYDAKNGKSPPAGSIPCCDPDPITGHWPHWLKVDAGRHADNWFWAAYYNSGGVALRDGTYEAMGSHFNGNPYDLQYDILEMHGVRRVFDVPRTFEGIREYLSSHTVEGLVFWDKGMPMCKIKRSDFGFDWPVRG